MIIINDSEGLGKPKWMKQIRMRNVSLKNAVKVGKFAVPIATSIIPGGGIASKVLGGKVGKSIGRIAKSKLVKKAVKLSKTRAGQMVVGQVKRRINSSLPLSTAEPINLAKIPATDFDSAVQTDTSNYDSNANQMSRESAEPVGELTPVKAVETPVQNSVVTPVESQPKDNTMMYVGLGVLAIGGLYLATKKSN